MTFLNCPSSRKITGAAALCLLLGIPSGLSAAPPEPVKTGALLSPWDMQPVKVKEGAYSCPAVATLPHDVVAFDYYSDSQHSIKDDKRYAAYTAVAGQYAQVDKAAELAV